MKKFLASLILAAVVSSAFGAGAPVKINVSKNQLTGVFGFLNLEVTALDDITINKITINRGKCKVAHPNFTYKFPQKFEFSASKIYMTNCRDILEVVFEIDGQEWKFSQN